MAASSENDQGTSKLLDAAGNVYLAVVSFPPSSPALGGAGTGGAVAVVFYDRHAPSPADRSVLPSHVGNATFCIDTSLQAFNHSGTGAVTVCGNVRISASTWDPEQPAQTINGIDQRPAPPTRPVHEQRVHR
jgi:hypothetical protein